MKKKIKGNEDEQLVESKALVEMYAAGYLDGYLLNYKNYFPDEQGKIELWNNICGDCRIAFDKRFKDKVMESVNKAVEEHNKNGS